MKNNTHHSEFTEEAHRLEKTINHLERELYTVETAPEIYGHKHELKVRNQYLSGKHLVLSDALLGDPYYGRFDFQEENLDEIEEFYVSKHQGLQLQNGPIRVIYWASPFGGLFSQTSRERVSFSTPDGEIRGSVFLRRHLKIKERVLHEIYDVFDKRPKTISALNIQNDDQPTAIDPNEFLRLVLEGKRGKGLQEVVASIQEQQNDLMRAPSDQVLIIQGAAGSGKTTIALHRVAILLYTPEGKAEKDPARIMIVGANKLFLRFISQVLPEINIHNVPQRTFIEWAQIVTGRPYFTNAKDLTFHEVYANPDSKKAKLAYARSKLKGSLVMKSILEELVKRYRLNAPLDGLALYPTGTGSLGIFYTVTEDVFQSFISETQHLEVNQQIRSVASKISNYIYNIHLRDYRAWAARIAHLVNTQPTNIEPYQLSKWEKQLEEYGYRRVEGKLQIPNFGDATQLRRAELRRDKALEAVKFEINQLVTNELSPNVSALNLYNKLLNDSRTLKNLLQIPPKNQQRQILKKRDEASERLKVKLEQYDLLFHDSEINKENIRIEDVAPLMYLHLLLEGKNINLQTYDHILVDEAQDMSPLEMSLLRDFTTSGSMTILGDLAQSIHSYRGISQWNEFSSVFKDNQWQPPKEIRQTYRSTFQIMSFANKILSGKLLRSLQYKQAIPFERHGEDVKFQGNKNYMEQLHFIAGETKRLISKPYASVAIICKTLDECKAIETYLRKLDYSPQLILSADTEIYAPLVVIPVNLAKGIEFDACIISNANNTTYSESEINGRLLYVAVTRALHELVVTWVGKPSPHLPGS